MKWWNTFIESIVLHDFYWLVAVAAVFVVLLVVMLVTGPHSIRIRKAKKQLKKSLAAGEDDGVLTRVAMILPKRERAIMLHCVRFKESTANSFSAYASGLTVKNLLIPMVYAAVQFGVGGLLALLAQNKEPLSATYVPTLVATLICGLLLLVIGVIKNSVSTRHVGDIGLLADQLIPVRSEGVEAVGASLADSSVSQSDAPGNVVVEDEEGLIAADKVDNEQETALDNLHYEIESEPIVTETEQSVFEDEKVSVEAVSAEAEEAERLLESVRASIEPETTTAAEKTEVKTVQAEDVEEEDRMAAEAVIAAIPNDVKPTKPAETGLTMEELIASAQNEAAEAPNDNAGKKDEKYDFRDLAPKTAAVSKDEPSADDFLEHDEDAPMEEHSHAADNDLPEDLDKFDNEEREQLASELRQRADEARAAAMKEQEIESARAHQEAERIRTEKAETERLQAEKTKRDAEEAKRIEEERARHEEEARAAAESLQRAEAQRAAERAKMLNDDEASITPEERRRRAHMRQAEEAREREAERIRAERARRVEASAPVVEEVKAQTVPTPIATAYISDDGGQGSDVDVICGEVEDLIARGATTQERAAMAMKLQAVRKKYHSAEESKRLQDVMTRFIAAFK